MPILDVEIVLRPGENLRDDLAAAIADAAAEVFSSAPGGTWVKVRPLMPNCYAEDGGGPPEGVQPVFVSVIKAVRPSPQMMPSEVSRLTAAIAHVCGRPEANVHVFYEPDAKGRVSFGGEVVGD